MEKLLRRKVDKYLMDWKNNPDRKPLIIKGARQIGKTRSIEWFANQNYKCVVQINFVEQTKYKSIFDDGFEVDAIIKNISLLNPDIMFIPGSTLFFFDELQACPNCATSLKFFKLDGRFDVICSGSLMGINYHRRHEKSRLFCILSVKKWIFSAFYCILMHTKLNGGRTWKIPKWYSPAT